MGSALAVRTHELNLVNQVGGLLLLAKHLSPHLWRFPAMEVRTESGISLPQFKCWLNYFCVR
jgi:hypothetical protein